MTDVVYLAPLIRLTEIDFTKLMNGKHVIAQLFAGNHFQYILYDSFEVGGEFKGVFHRTPKGIFKMLSTFCPEYPQAINKPIIILGGVYTLKTSPGMGLTQGQTVLALTQYHNGRVTVIKCDPDGNPDELGLKTWVFFYTLEFSKIADNYYLGVS